MRSREAVPLLVLVLAAALVRFATIDVQSYWADEELTAWLVRKPFGGMLHHLPHTELTPPLYYLVAWLWIRVFGHLELGLRSLSALCGIATVPVVHLAARELVSRRVALALAALVAFNPVLIWYSQEARPYAMLVLLTALATLFFLRRRLALWALTAILALLTHYFAAFLLVPQALWLVWTLRSRNAFIATGSLFAVGVALVPLALKEHAQISSDYISVVSLRRRLIGVPEDFLTGFVIKWDTTKEKIVDAVALAVAAVGVALALLRTDVEERRALRFALVGVACAVVVPALLAIVGPDFLDTRNVIAGCVPALAVLALGFGARRNGRLVALGGVAALCAIGLGANAIVDADTSMHRSDWRGAARALGPARTTRLVAAPVYAGEIALDNYLTRIVRMPLSGTRVSELVVLTPRNPQVGGPRAARPVRPVPPTPRFHLVERRYAKTWSLVRFTASSPQLVTVPDVARAGEALMTSPGALLQLAGSSAR